MGLCDSDLTCCDLSSRRARGTGSVLALSALAGIVGAYLTLAQDAEPLLAIEAAGTAFLSWALAREIDPDRQIPALVLAVVGGAWALLGFETAILPFTALLMSARVVVETTGRRPLPTDLAGLAVLATVVSYTPLGWVMGFGLAVAIYIDARMAEEPNRAALFAALAGAIGSSVVASLSGTFPRTLPTVDPTRHGGVGCARPDRCAPGAARTGVIRRQPDQEVPEARPPSGGPCPRRDPRVPRRARFGSRLLRRWCR